MKKSKPLTQDSREKNRSNQYKSYAHHSARKRLPTVVPTGISPTLTSEFDRDLHAFLLSEIFYLSPPTVGTAYFDWFINLYCSPGKQVELTQSAWKKFSQLADFHCSIYSQTQPKACAAPLLSDTRFEDEGWKTWPYTIFEQTFLLTEQWWVEATRDMLGITQHHSELLPFLSRQFLDSISPLNFPITNPTVMRATFAEQGMNFIRGWQNYTEDLSRFINKAPPVGIEEFKVGVNLAVTEGEGISQ